LKTNELHPVLKLCDFFVSIIAFGRSESINSIRLMDEVRSISGNTYIQGFNTKVIFGKEHLIEALKITLEALKRGITVANRPEVDLMLRIACTNQISEAIRYAGIKEGEGVCFIIFTKNEQELLKVRNYILAKLPDPDFSELGTERRTRMTISTRLGVEASSYYLIDDHRFLKYLVERAALVTK
jgi:tRNA threonylcarbamoyladenosine modification (KEOPS) complex Cgi121 subunit